MANKNKGRPKKQVATLYKRTTESGYTNFMISVPKEYVEELRLKYDEKKRVKFRVEASRDANFMSLFPVETPTYGEWVDTLIPEKMGIKKENSIVIDNNDRKKKGTIKTDQKILLKKKIIDSNSTLTWINELREEAKEYYKRRMNDLDEAEKNTKKKISDYEKQLGSIKSEN